MAIYKCKMCGGIIDIADGVTRVTCPNCGTEQQIAEEVVVEPDATANIQLKAKETVKTEFNAAKYQALKYEVETLTETVKKDEEKIATLKSKLEEQKTINQATKRTNILILVIALCLGPLGIIISCFLLAKQNQSVKPTNRVLKNPEILSSELNATMKVAEKHKAELESKQKELDVLLLGL